LADTQGPAFELAPPLGGSPPPPQPRVDAPSVAPIPQADPRSGPSWIVLVVVGAFVALVMTAGIVVATLATAARDEPIVAPPSEVTVDPSEAPDPSGAASVGIAARLDAKMDEYRRLRDTGELWETIPDSEYNRTAVSAFLFFLTDMKVATIWGVDDAQAAEYDERMTELEGLLLEQKPLGDDIRITFEDGTTFTYDGETGEGGYSPE
jgi:hypothetical protein